MAPHNLWIEAPISARQGDEVACRVLFGHHFNVEGNLNPAEVNVWLAPPGEEMMPLTPRVEGNGLTVQFRPESPGTYTVLAGYRAGIWSITGDGQHLPGKRENYPHLSISQTVLYYHLAKTFIPVNGELTWPGSFGQALEFIPLASLREGIELLVQHDGRPFAGAKVYAQNRTGERSRVGRTDAEGKVLLVLPPGDWLLITYAQDKPAGEAQYDGRLLTAVLTLRIPDRASLGANS